MPARHGRRATRPRRARIYAVRRLEGKRAPGRGWYVILKRKGRTFSRLFSDGVHGGREAALAAALRYRDEIVRKHPPISRREYAQMKRRNNRSGVTGIHKVLIPRSHNGKRYEPVWYWVASWRPRPGEFMRKSFSVKKYGEAGAFKRALAARRRGLAEMESGPHITHPGQAPRSGPRR